MSRQTTAITTPSLEPFSAQPVWTETMQSEPPFSCTFYQLLSHQSRIRTKLSSGEMAIPGDQWPLLVYANQEYNPEEPWDGLFRSLLLVWVSTHSFSFVLLFTLLHAGLQAYLHLTQLSREGGKSNEIWQCLYPWHDLDHYGLLSLCSHTGASGIGTLSH
jgi:hypothetical protein